MDNTYRTRIYHLEKLIKILALKANMSFCPFCSGTGIIDWFDEICIKCEGVG